MSCSLLALSSSGGRSARITWKAWGRSVLLERLQPPQCSPLLTVTRFKMPLFVSEMMIAISPDRAKAEEKR